MGQIYGCISLKKKTLHCRLCYFDADIGRRSTLKTHNDSEKHKRRVRLNQTVENGTVQQTLSFVVPSTTTKNSEFNSDLAKALIASNIPLYKTENPTFSDFLEKYTKQPLPCRSSLTKLMENQSKDVLIKVKEQLVNKSIFVSIDETTDASGRAMCIVLAGPLDGEFLKRPFMIDLVNLGDTNNRTVQQCVNSALLRLLGDDLDYNSIKLFLTDGAAYCVKAGRGRASMYPNLTHCLCLAHGLNRVAELVRYNYPNVDKLISEIKKIFVKCGRRKSEFTAACKIPLPPEPILTR